MRLVVLSISLLIAGCEGEQNSQEKAVNPVDPKAFAFRDLVAMKTTYDQAIEGEALTDCEKNPNTGDRTCKFAKTQIAGIDTTEVHVDFVDETFDYLDAQFASYNYEALRDKLSSVYGKVCQTEAQQEEWRKRLGFVDRGREVEWCFNNGKLNLMEHSRHGWDGGELEFLSNREPRPEKRYDQSNL